MNTVGMDEVGRGCWAGPLVAGAVMLSPDFRLEDCPLKLRDSKKLSRKQREATAAWIQEHAVAVGLGWVEPAEVDRLGLSAAVRVAFERALAKITHGYDELIIDGNINYFVNNPKARALVKADDLVPSVSAASIVAKVARDAHMRNLSEAYAGYGFEMHVGYGTTAHRTALELLGVSDIHRRSFKPIQAFLA